MNQVMYFTGMVKTALPKTHLDTLQYPEHGDSHGQPWLAGETYDSVLRMVAHMVRDTDVSLVMGCILRLKYNTPNDSKLYEAVL